MLVHSGQKTWMSAAKQPLMTVADGWQELSGAFRLPASGGCTAARNCRNKIERDLFCAICKLTIPCCSTPKMM